MPSKYRIKAPKPRVKQGGSGYIPKVRYTCTNCGGTYCILNVPPTHSKCRCGGTFQTYKGKIE